jgi:hypothetical protein
MAYNFIHRILNAEIPAPESSWDKIVTALDKAGATGFVEKLSQAIVEPPAIVWQQIASALDTTGIERKRSVPAGWMRWSAAALVIGVIIISASYFFYTRSSSNNIATTSTSNNTVASPNGNAKHEGVAGGSDLSKDTSSVLQQADATANKDQQKRKGRQREVFPVRHAVIETAEADNGGQLGETQPNISDNVSPAAGKYIPPPDHFVVTAPNGERAKISTKFSNAVASLMGGDNVDYLWKSKFDNWKSKLISNPTFIPTAGNFLDIAELKDLIKEQ